MKKSKKPSKELFSTTLVKSHFVQYLVCSVKLHFFAEFRSVTFRSVPSFRIGSSAELWIARDEHFLQRNNGNRSESIPRNFFGMKFCSQPYTKCIYIKITTVCVPSLEFVLSHSLSRQRVRLGLGTEFRSEKIPRNRLGTVSVIPRKKAVIPRHSEFRGRANSEARNGTERNGIPRKY